VNKVDHVRGVETQASVVSNHGRGKQGGDTGHDPAPLEEGEGDRQLHEGAQLAVLLGVPHPDHLGARADIQVHHLQMKFRKGRV
jgi:hypothetical protein